MLLPDHGEELVAGDEFDLAPLGKPSGFLSESARCHDKTTSGPLRRHHTVEFPHNRNADLSCPPLLALNHVPIVAVSDDNVDASIRASTTSFFNCETAPPEKLANQQLKLLPRHGFEGAITRSGSGMQRVAFAPGEDGTQRPGKECNRQNVLPEHRKRLQKLLADRVSEAFDVGGHYDFYGREVMQQQVRQNRENNPDPPRKLGGDLNQNFQ